jgi:hypothetical protein
MSAVCLIASFAHAAPVVTTDSTLDKSVTAATDELYYAGGVSTTDLLAGIAGAHSGWRNDNGALDVSLNDGLAGGDFDAVGLAALVGAAWANDTGTSSVYVLGAGDGAGYDITEIQSIAAWTSGSGFPNQKYNVSVRYFGDTTYTFLTTVEYQPFPGTTAAAGGSTKVNLTDDTGILAGGIDAIRFDFLTTTDIHSTASTVFREIDVQGSATPTGTGETIIYSDTFSGTGGLHGKAVEMGAGTWTACPNWGADGTVTSGSGSAALDFIPEQGKVYELTATIHLMNNDSSWVGLGFADAGTNWEAFENGTVTPYNHNYIRFTDTTHDWITGRGWMYTSPTGGQNSRDDVQTELPDAGGYTNFLGVNTDINVKIVLDASGTDWTTTFYVNNVLFSSYTDTGATSIDSVGFTSTAGATGSIDNFSLTTASDLTSPDVTIETPDMIAWSGEPVALDAAVVNNDDGDPQAALTFDWSTNAPAGYTVDFSPSAAVEDSTVTITKDADTDDATVVTVTLAVNNVGSTRPDVTDSMTIDVYDDACKAAIANNPSVIESTDFDSNCITELNDLAQMAAAWLENYTLDAPVPAGPGEPLRIMPLGDSITAGYTDNSDWTVPFEFGYRSGLYTRLTNAGYNFQFVGESAEPWNGIYGVPSNTPILDLRPLGQDKHRGYGGETILETNSGAAGYIANDNPDIILLLIGINGNLNRANPAELEILVNTIFTADPDVHLVVAQITPYHPDYNDRNIDDIIPYNTYIRDTLVPTRAAQGYHISTVDMYSLFLSNPADPTSVMTGLHSNNINHPTNAVYDQMAQVWFEEVQRIWLK